MLIISCDEASDTRVLAARLAAQPKRLAKALERLDLMENTQGELRRADEAERRVTEILWETGQELLTGWAGQVADAVTAEARAAVPVVGHVCAGHGALLPRWKSYGQVFAEPKARRRARASPRGGV